MTDQISPVAPGGEPAPPASPAWPVAPVLIAITLLALAARVLTVADKSVWFDEAFSIRMASLPPSQMLAAIQVRDAHPPLYYLLLHAWMALGGSGEPWLRVLSLLTGTAVVPLTALLAGRLFGWRTGAVAALLVAVSPAQIITSQQIRMYAPLTLLTVLGTLLCWTALRSEHRALWAAYAVTMAAALYTHYFAALTMLAHGLYIALYERRRAAILPWAAGVLAAALAFAPWVPGLLRQVSTGVLVVRPWREPVGGEHLAEALGLLTFGGHLFGATGYIGYGRLSSQYVLLLALPFLAAAWHGLRRARASGRLPEAMLVLCAGLVPLGTVFAVSVAVRLFYVFYVKYFTFLAPMMSILIARGVVEPPRWSSVPRRVLAPALLAVLLALNGAAAFAYVRDPAFRIFDWRGVAAYVAQSAPADLVAFIPRSGMLPFDYYYPDHLKRVQARAWYTAPRTDLPDDPRRDPGPVRATVAQWPQRHPRVWLVMDPGPFPRDLEDVLLRLLGERYERTEVRQFGVVQVIQWTVRP